MYSSINETVDTSQLVEDGYYSAPKSVDKVSVSCMGLLDSIAISVPLSGYSLTV